MVFPPQAPPAYSVPLGQGQSRFRREYHPFYNYNYKVATPRYIIALQLNMSISSINIFKHIATADFYESIIIAFWKFYLR